MSAELTIRRRPPKEVLAFYDGQIAAYEMLLKIWPTRKKEIKSFLIAAKHMKESASEYTDNEKYKLNLEKEP